MNFAVPLRVLLTKQKNVWVAHVLAFNLGAQDEDPKIAVHKVSDQAADYIQSAVQLKHGEARRALSGRKAHWRHWVLFWLARIFRMRNPVRPVLVHLVFTDDAN